MPLETWLTNHQPSPPARSRDIHSPSVMDAIPPMMLRRLVHTYLKHTETKVNRDFRSLDNYPNRYIERVLPAYKNVLLTRYGIQKHLQIALLSVEIGPYIFCIR
ncbi:hypothetical protein BH10CYA1_BH10CYA1_47750 [soil metagenome]